MAKALVRAGKVLTIGGKIATDGCATSCCGCAEVQPFTACTDDPCADEPPELWVCVPIACDRIKWGQRCYRAVGQIIPIAQVPDGGIIVTTGMYSCVTGCDDPQCEPQCPRYKQAVMCPGQPDPPCPMFMPAQNVTVCGIFREAGRCWYIDPSFPSVTELPANACIRAGGIRPNRTCCDFIDVGEPCVEGCSPSFARQYPCFGPECPPQTVTELKCCCSIAGVYTVSSYWKWANILLSNTAIQEETHNWTIEVDEFGSTLELSGSGTQRNRFIDGSGVVIQDETVSLPFPGGIPWSCGLDACEMFVYRRPGVGGLIMGACQSNPPFNGSSTATDFQGRLQRILSAVKTVTCTRYNASGRYLTTAGPGDTDYLRTEEEFRTTFTAVYSGSCSGGCGSSSLPPGGRSQLGVKGWTQAGTNTGCASCGNSIGTNTGDAPASL